ncbi:MAG: hypothetical protein LBD14_06760 [Puniceicoccales bacterium]|jgi:hypothetical protein|nr:hypothetical protein [Puniceicoccales bacterium]
MSLRKHCVLAGKASSFPDKTFVCDSNARSFMTFLCLKRNWFVSLSLVFHVVFLFSLVPLAISKTGGFYVALPVATLIFSMVFGILAVLSVRRPKCSQCSERMKKEWFSLASNEKALFFTCEKDRRYVDAFLKRKPVVKNENSRAEIFLIRFFLFALFFPFINAFFLSVCLFAKSVSGMDFGQQTFLLLSGVPVALLGMYINPA